MLLTAFCISLPAVQAERLTGGWEYRRGDLGGPYEALRSKAAHNLGIDWEPVTVPHCFNATDAVNPYVRYYQGPGWYRTKLRVENPYEEGRTLLRFDGAGQKTRVYVGESLVGTHVGRYDEFTFDLTDTLVRHGVREGTVDLLVRCDNSRDLQMIPSDLSDFNLYGGLYRPVHLLYQPAVSERTERPIPELPNPGRRARESPQQDALRPGNGCRPV